MAIPIDINGTIVQIPSSGDSPNWAPAIIEAFQLIAAALAINVTPFDIPPQIYSMISNVNTNITIPNLEFPPAAVNGAIVFYSVVRNSLTPATIDQSGILMLNYDGNSSSWQINNQWVGPGAGITFSVTNSGQLQFSTISMANWTNGFISFRGLAVLNNT